MPRLLAPLSMRQPVPRSDPSILVHPTQILIYPRRDSTAVVEHRDRLHPPVFVRAFILIEKGECRRIQKPEEIADNPILRLSAETDSRVPAHPVQASLYSRRSYVTGGEAK